MTDEPPLAGPPPAGPGAKPPQVVSAGIIEIVLGILILLVTAYLFLNIPASDLRGAVIVLLLIQAAQGILDLAAGIMVMRLRPAGRILAIVMAAIGAAFAAFTLAQGVPASTVVLVLIGITLRVLVIVFLNQAQSRAAFGA